MCAFVLFWVSFPDAWTAFASSEGGGRQSPNKKTNTNSNPVNKKTHATVMIRGQYMNPLAGAAQNWQKYFFRGHMFAYNKQQHAYIC